MAITLHGLATLIEKFEEIGHDDAPIRELAIKTLQGENLYSLLAERLEEPRRLVKEAFLARSYNATPWANTDERRRVWEKLNVFFPPWPI